MKNILFLLLLFLLTFPVISQNGWRENEKEIKVILHNQQEADRLYNLHLNGDIYPNGTAILYVVPSELEKVKKAGLKYEILIGNLNEHYKDFWETREGYHDYMGLVQLSDSLAQNFPEICQKIIYGYSINDREIAALKISDNVGYDETEAEILLDGGIHGNEIGGPENCIRFARNLCIKYNDDPYWTDLVDNHEIWILYLINPDGRAAMTRYNDNGVDLNRDCGYFWNGEGSSDAPFSQPESKILRDMVISHQFAVHITYHSGVEMAIFPWGFRYDTIPDYDANDFLTTLYAEVSGYPSLYHGPSVTLYAVNGSTEDWNYGANGSAGMTMEISNNKQPPESEIMYWYDINEPSMLAMIEQSGYGIEGLVTDATTSEPIAAVMVVNDFYPAYTDPAIGDYHKYVLPGTYSVKAFANGYKTQTVEDIIVAENSATTVDFQLQPVGGYYAYKLVEVAIPGNNWEDEGLTPAALGKPDSINYSMGKNGWIVLDMHEPLLKGPGNDLKIYEGDDSPEGFTCYIAKTPDGPWYLVGEGLGTTEFDIDSIIIFQPDYVKLVDDGDGQGWVDNAGYDLNAVQCIAVPLEVVNPYPSISQNNIDPWIDFLWEDGGGGWPLYYKFYLGKDNPPTNIINGDSVIVSSYHFEEWLDFDTHYYWRVDVYNEFGSSTGTLWDFYTVESPDEDFETGDFSSYNWLSEGDAAWIVDDSQAFSGLYSARSGDIEDGESTSLKLELDVEGIFNYEISFVRKCSSQTGDKLLFYIDNLLKGQWSGIDFVFNKETFLVSSGLHTFEWKYIKDGSGSFGNDCVWIDYIYLPPLAPPTVDAGNDTTVCENSSITLEGYATNYISILWETSGTGTFDDNKILNATYTPGEEDITAGSVILTLKVFANEVEYSDDMILTIEYLPEKPAQPEGPEYVDILYTSESEYSTTIGLYSATYEWEISPQEAGIISGDSLTGTVTWDQYFVGTVFVSVLGINNCGESEISDEFEVTVFNSVGYLDHNSISDVVISPNPSNGSFRMAFDAPKEIELSIKILNAWSSTIYRQNTTVNGDWEQFFDLNLAKGIYFIHLESLNHTTIKKLIIQ